MPPVETFASRCEFSVPITAEDVARFAQLSGDRNPLHLDAAYAGTTEFGRPIVHGAFLLGLVSRVLGMEIPGPRSLFLGVNARFPKPAYYPGSVRVSASLGTFNEARQSGTVLVRITDEAKGWAVLEAEASFALHQQGADAAAPPSLQPSAPKPSDVSAPAGTRRLLMTGGTGGLGSQVLARLGDAYAVTSLARRAAGRESPRLRSEQIDLEAPGVLERFLAQASPAEYDGILHMSAPPAPRGFVSDDLDAVRRQWRHGVEVPLLLAKWARQPGSSVKRLVFIGSLFGLKAPKPQLGAYSLGKAALEYLPRLLVADLAAQGATVNVVTPGVLPLGMNEGLPARAQAMLKDQTPTRALTQAGDVAQVISFLLSDAAAQVNGVTIAVDGGVTA